MADVELKARLSEMLEELYSKVNKRRFYELLGDWEAEKVEQFRREAAAIAGELKLTEEEVEEMADELDEYYVSGRSKRGEGEPLDYWLNLAASRSRGGT